MSYLWIVLGGFCLLLGMAGCFLPVLPGPILAYAALWCLVPIGHAPSLSTLLGCGIAMVLVLLLDSLSSTLGTKKFGGSRWGIAGSVAGAFVGLFFSLPGLILGPFLGAFAGERIAGRNSSFALRAAFGSFLGFLFGSLLKFILCLFYSWLFFAAL